ncbi:MAG: Clp protease N-terminal domain-containing protein [Planctomycetota bacterium]
MIAWFWELVSILRRNGECVRLIKTRRPGYVLYEDSFQVAATPFRDTFRPPAPGGPGPGRVPWGIGRGRYGGRLMWEAVQGPMGRARLEAIRLRHPYVGTEHLLLALLLEEPRLFAQVGLEREQVQELVSTRVEKGKEPVPDEAQLLFTSRAKRVLELAAAQSMQAFDDQVRPEYLFVGLAEEAEGIAGLLLAEQGCTADRLRSTFRLEALSTELRERVHGSRRIWEREPFTRLMGAAHEEAQRLSHSYIGTEHLLLAVLAEPDGQGATMLEELGVDCDRIRDEVERLVEPGVATPRDAGQLPFTQAAQRALLTSRTEAVDRGEDAISSGHLLLGLTSEDEGTAGEILRNSFGISAEYLRELL